MGHVDVVERHIRHVEAFLGHALQAKLLDAGAYADAVTALAEAQLALARAGRPAAEAPLRRASAAESRLFERRAVSPRVRHSVRAAVAAALCLADGHGPDEANGWLSRLRAVVAA
jgi:hypothetical protein